MGCCFARCDERSMCLYSVVRLVICVGRIQGDLRQPYCSSQILGSGGMRTYTALFNKSAKLSRAFYVGKKPTWIKNLNL